MTYRLEDITANVLQLLAWDRIMQIVGDLLKMTDQTLNDAAHELHLHDKIEDFRTTFHQIVAAWGDIHGHMDELIVKRLTYEDISDELGVVFNSIQEWLKTNFPPPNQAPVHENERR